MIPNIQYYLLYDTTVLEYSIKTTKHIHSKLATCDCTTRIRCSTVLKYANVNMLFDSKPAQLLLNALYSLLCPKCLLA